MGIFSLTVTTDLKLPVKNDDLENSENTGKEKSLAKWQLGLIIGAVTFLILLITVLVICRVKRDSKKRGKIRINGSYGGRNELQLVSLEDENVNDYAGDN